MLFGDFYYQEHIVIPFGERFLRDRLQQRRIFPVDPFALGAIIIDLDEWNSALHLVQLSRSSLSLHRQTGSCLGRQSNNEKPRVLDS